MPPAVVHYYFAPDVWIYVSFDPGSPCGNSSLYPDPGSRLGRKAIGRSKCHRLPSRAEHHPSSVLLPWIGNDPPAMVLGSEDGRYQGASTMHRSNQAPKEQCRLAPGPSTSSSESREVSSRLGGCGRCCVPDLQCIRTESVGKGRGWWIGGLLVVMVRWEGSLFGFPRRP
jgi:hypothetical protein